MVEDRIEKEKARRKAELEGEQLKCAVKVKKHNTLTAKLKNTKSSYFKSNLKK